MCYFNISILPYRMLNRIRRDETNTSFKVTGVRAEHGNKEPSLNERGVPELYAGGQYQLRLFGINLTSNMLITLTRVKGSFGEVCHLPATPMFPVSQI